MSKMSVASLVMRTSGGGHRLPDACEITTPTLGHNFDTESVTAFHVIGIKLQHDRVYCRNAFHQLVTSVRNSRTLQNTAHTYTFSHTEKLCESLTRNDLHKDNELVGCGACVAKGRREGRGMPVMHSKKGASATDLLSS